MRLLLDTHVLLWWLADNAQLGPGARDLIADPANDILVSVVSLWEIQVKVRAGKLEADLQEILSAITTQAFELLAVDPAHLLGLATLPKHHNDPFDHLLIAQAIVEAVPFMSADRHVPDYPVQVIPCS